MDRPRTLEAIPDGESQRHFGAKIIHAGADGRFSP
jgi:hypothetical protein